MDKNRHPRGSGRKGGEFAASVHDEPDDVSLYDYPESDDSVDELEDDSPTDFRGHYDGPVPIEVYEPPPPVPVPPNHVSVRASDLQRAVVRARAVGYPDSPEVVYDHNGEMHVPQDQYDEIQGYVRQWREDIAAKQEQRQHWLAEQRELNERLWGKS